MDTRTSPFHLRLTRVRDVLSQSGVDALLMGRKTFDLVCSFPGEWPYGARPVYVLTRSPSNRQKQDKPGARIEFVQGEPAKILEAIQARGIKRIYVDGGETIRLFLKAGLVSEMTLTRVPVLIGRGVPLFGDLDRDVQLQLQSVKSYPSGLLQTRYRVMPS